MTNGFSNTGHKMVCYITEALNTAFQNIECNIWMEVGNWLEDHYKDNLSSISGFDIVNAIRVEGLRRFTSLNYQAREVLKDK